MPDPTSQLSQMITNLAEFLTQETIAFYADMDWQYYSNIHSPGDSPKGAVYVPKVKTVTIQNNYAFTPSSIRFISVY